MARREGLNTVAAKPVESAAPLAQEPFYKNAGFTFKDVHFKDSYGQVLQTYTEGPEIPAAPERATHIEGLVVTKAGTFLMEGANENVKNFLQRLAKYVARTAGTEGAPKKSPEEPSHSSASGSDLAALVEKDRLLRAKKASEDYLRQEDAYFSQFRM